jgi:heptosyltransferase-2
VLEKNIIATEKMRLSLNSLSTANPSDIVWIQTAFLGDIILNTGAFELAARSFPGVRQHVITTSLGVRVLEGLESVYSRIVFEKRKESLFSSFRKVATELRENLRDSSRTVILQPHRSFRSSLLSRFLGFKVGTYFETNLGFTGARTSRVGVFHEAVRTAMLLELVGVSREQITKAKPRLAGKSLDPTIAWQARLAERKAKAGKRLIAVAPGSQWGTKRWTLEGYADLCKSILRDPELSRWDILLMGSAEEKSLCEDLASRIYGEDRVVNLAGVTAINDLRSIFPILDLLIGNDSSPVQFASAFNIPTVAIFGSTIPSMGFGPLADGSRVVQLQLECRPCSDHGPETCPLGHFKCMRDLGADHVFKVCREILSGRD